MVKKGIIKFALALYTLYGMLALRFRTLLQVSSSFELFLIGTGIKRHYFVDQKKTKQLIAFKFTLYSRSAL